MCAKLYIKKTMFTCSSDTTNEATPDAKVFCHEVKRSFDGLLVSLSVTPMIAAGTGVSAKRRLECGKVGIRLTQVAPTDRGLALVFAEGG
jgi:hypothetical protein